MKLLMNQFPFDELQGLKNGLRVSLHGAKAEIDACIVGEYIRACWQRVALGKQNVPTNLRVLQNRFISAREGLVIQAVICSFVFDKASGSNSLSVAQSEQKALAERKVVAVGRHLMLFGSVASGAFFDNACARASRVTHKGLYESLRSPVGI